MDQSATYGQMDFSLPHDVVQLPTGGIFYKSKKKSVKVGYLTASDENILIGAANSSGKDGIVISLLRNKIYEPDLRPEELLNSDVEAILIFLRNTSFGPEYNVSLTDPQTGKKFDVTIVLDELNIKKCKVQPDEDGTLQTKLPRSGNTIKLKPISICVIDVDIYESTVEVLEFIKDHLVTGSIVLFDDFNCFFKNGERKVSNCSHSDT